MQFATSFAQDVRGFILQGLAFILCSVPYLTSNLLTSLADRYVYHIWRHQRDVSLHGEVTMAIVTGGQSQIALD